MNNTTTNFKAKITKDIAKIVALCPNGISVIDIASHIGYTVTDIYVNIQNIPNLTEISSEENNTYSSTWITS